jgi:hypothetical protein
VEKKKKTQVAKTAIVPVYQTRESDKINFLDGNFGSDSQLMKRIDEMD